MAGKIKKIIRFAIVIACFSYIISFFYKEKGNLELLLELRVSYLALILLLGVLYLFVHCYRFKIIIEKCSGSSLSFWKWFRIFSQARFLNIVIPQLGNIYRGISLKKFFNISYTNYISAFASFAWMDTCFNLLVATAIISLFARDLKIGRFNALGLLSVLTVLIITTPVLMKLVLSKLPIRAKKLAWLKGRVNEVLHATITNLKDVKYFLIINSLGLLVMVRTILIYYILFYSLGVQPQIVALLLFYALFKISSFFIITPGNIGIQEIAFGFLSDQLGIGMAEGILVCVIGRVVGTLVVIIFGVATGGISVLRHKEDYLEQNEL
ncbi:lysylphosphatidylglycerol synthase transmembrane domain-containing protein [Planctomycetota bacterium]